MFISKSTLNTKPLNIGEIQLELTGVTHINIPPFIRHVDFVPSSIKITWKDKIIYIDPIMISDEDKGDIILITHSHQDHFSLKSISKLIKEDTIVVCPVELGSKLRKICSHTVVMEPLDTIDFGEIEITGAYAYNNRGGLMKPHPKKRMFLGYVLDINNTRIYHLGDTDLIPEMDELGQIDILLTPIDGKNLTLSTEDAAKLGNLLESKYIVPIHFDIASGEHLKLEKLIESGGSYFSFI